MAISILQIVQEILTGPKGIPKAVFKSSERSPGFFSFNLVSNSFPLTNNACV